MGRPALPKTELAQRLIALRGDEKRADFCDRLGLSERTYGNYERGTRVPDSDVLIKIAASGKISMNWLLLGSGPMRLGSAEQQRVSIAATHRLFFGRVLDAVQKAYGDVGIRLPPAECGEIAAAKYDEYIAMATDPDDEEERIALMNLLRTRLRKELQAQIAEPGTDKATA